MDNPCVSSGLYLSGHTIITGMNTTCVSHVYMQGEHESLNVSNDKN